MKKNYLSSIVAMRLCLWLLFLCLFSNVQVVAQGRNLGGGASSSVSSPQKVVMPRMTKSNSGNAVSVNGAEYATWADAVTAINNNTTDTEFNIVLLKHVMDAKEIPGKACTISGTTSDVNFAFVDGEGNLVRIQMTAPLTFKDITLQVSQIAANGHALTFDEGVTCAGNNSCINNIWAGSSAADVVETNLTIKSGSFNWIYAGSGNTGKVGTTNLTIEGGTIYGGVFGGSYSGECTTTNIKIEGGTIKWDVYGGGYLGKVGTTNVTVSGGEIEGSVFGGGCGVVGTLPALTAQYSACENTNVIVSGGKINVRLYGGGSPGKVTGTAKVTVTDGIVNGAIFGGGGIYNSIYDYTTATCQNTDLTIMGGTGFCNEGIFAGGDNAAVLGNAKLTFTGDFTLYDTNKPKAYAAGQWAACENAEIIIATDLKDKLAGISANTGKEGSIVTEESKLTFKDLGSNSAAYDLPYKVEGFTTVALDNSYLKAETDANCFVSDLMKPTTFRGTGFVSPVKIDTKESTTEPEKVLFMAEEKPDPAIFSGVNHLAGKKIFRLNKTYHLTDVEAANWKTITFTAAGGDELAVRLDTTALLSGDKIPTGLDLDIEAVSQYNYATRVKNNGLVLASNTLTVAADAALTMEAVEYLDLAVQKQDVTISMKESKWQYQAKAILRSSEPPVYNFNGTVKNALEDAKTVVIDATAKGPLTFEDAKINSATTVAPALTIQSGARVSFSGTLEVQTGQAEQYGIVNNGNLTVTGTSTSVTSTNTTSGSDKGIKVDVGASIVSEKGTTLTTSGMSNTGTVVVKDGATATAGNNQPLQKTYLVTVVDPGNGNKLVIKAGDIEVKDKDKVAEKTKLTVSGAPTSDYTLKSITVTPETEVAQTLANNAVYEMPGKEVTFAATFQQEQSSTYYMVTIPSVEGAITTPLAGSYEVEEGSDFSFDLALDKGYEGSKPVVKANDVIVEPNVASKKYVISDIRALTKITIEGIVKDNPTGNAEVEGGVKVQAVNSSLSLYLPKEEAIYIYSLSGVLYKEQVLPGGETRIPLTRGIYLIKIARMTYKVVI